MTEAKTTTNELIAGAQVLIERSAKFLVIQSEGEVALAGEFRARAHQQTRDLDAERLEKTRPLREQIEAINLEYNDPIGKLKEKVAVIDKAILTYQREQRELAEAAERARQEEAQRLEAERAEAERKRQAEFAAARAEAEAANAPPPPEPEPLPPAVIPAPVILPAPRAFTGTYGSKVATRENWKYRIVDIKKVPEEFLVPVEDRVNKSALNALARSMKGNGKVKGVEFYSEDSLTSRVS